MLARKWRPQSFDEVCGQAHVTTPLRNAIRTGRVPHALLFAGPRGVGKTTLARILARCLNCDKGPTESPCGSCPPCREIAAGSSTDVQEIDAASRTSVDDVRELIEAVRYAPSPGKHRIYVVDEVHMLSTQAFNALLKTLEEPPPRTVFVFATTNPEKIPFTVVSRCQRYDLRRLPTEEIVARLEEIAASEGIEIGKASLRAIARESDGSMRDAQTLLDQLIAYGGSRVSDEQVREVLDLIDRRVILRIARACVAGDAAGALAAVAEAGHAGQDPARVGAALLGLLRDLVVLQVAPEHPELVEGTDEEREELREVAAATDAGRLRRMFRALLREQEELALAPDPRAVLEMTCVRLATLPAGDDVARLLARLDALERQLREGSPPGAPPPGPGGPGPAGAPPRGNAPRRRTGSSGATPPEAAPEPSGAGGREAPPSRGEARPEGAARPSPPLPDDAPPAVVFDRIREFVRRRDRVLHAALEGGRIAERSEDGLRLVVPRPFAARRLTDHRAALEAVLAEFFGRPVRVEIGAEDTAEPEPGALRAPRVDPEVLRERRRRALDHPAVNAAVEILGGEILEIHPVTGDRPL